MKGYRYKGSLTIEAALIVPIFLYCMVGFIYFIQMITLHESIQHSITNLSFDISKFGYLYDEVNIEDMLIDDTVDKNEEEEKEPYKRIGKDILETFNLSIDSLFTNHLFQTLVKEHILDDNINLSIIENGQAGIYSYFSTFMEEDENVHIIVHYKVKIPFGILSSYNIPMLQRVTIRSWSKEAVEKKGEKEESKEEVVYVTEHGEVYHKHKECTYINIKLTKVRMEDLLKEERYKGFTSCSRCIKDKLQGLSIVYITETGSKYHSSTLCSSLKRLVKEIGLEESKKYRQCTRCFK